MNNLTQTIDWAKHVSFAVTICTTTGEIIYMNEQSKATFAKHGNMIGKNLKDCHPERAWKLILKLLETGQSNSYTIDKQGKKKIIHQTPWYNDDQSVGGLVEISIILPSDMPHYVR